MDPGSEGVIEVASPIGSEEAWPLVSYNQVSGIEEFSQYPVVVFQGTKEDRHQSVPLKVFSPAPGEEYIRFIKQDDRIPCFSQFEVFG